MTPQTTILIIFIGLMLVLAIGPVAYLVALKVIQLVKEKVK